MDRMSGYKLQPNEQEFFINSLTAGVKLSCILTKAITQEQIESCGPNNYPFDKKLVITSQQPHLPTCRAVIIMHGIGGHKNYNYHSKLARKLAHEHGIASIRFDFRNCGFSTKTDGRTLQDDIEDCQAVYQYLIQEGYSVDALIGHSRGVVDVFNWQLTHLDTFVPNLVACAGRFIGKGLPESIRAHHPNFESEGGHYIQGFQDGSVTKVFVPLTETQSLGELEMSTVKKITKYSNTLCVYGLKEEIIPLKDAAHYSNCLQGRNELVFVNNATHSFYGEETIPENRWSTSKVPVNERKGKLDYNYEVADILTKWLDNEEVRKRFYEQHKMIHEFLPRWKDIEGVCNFRDIGGWQSALPSWSSGKHVKYGRVFRCASIDNMTPQGQLALKQLGITKVYDFRSQFEVQRGQFENLKDVEFISLEAEAITEDSKQFYYGMAESWQNYQKVYEYLVEEVIPTYKPIFEHLRDSQDPVLYHCTAGKDRTGTMTAMILKLLRVPNEIIAREYELTVEGLKPAHAQLAHFVQPLLAKSGLPEHPSIENLLGSKYEVMIAFLLNFDKKYLQVEHYFEQKMGFSQQDLETIRQNLLF